MSWSSFSLTAASSIVLGPIYCKQVILIRKWQHLWYFILNCFGQYFAIHMFHWWEESKATWFYTLLYKEFKLNSTSKILSKVFPFTVDKIAGVYSNYYSWFQATKMYAIWATSSVHKQHKTDYWCNGYLCDKPTECRTNIEDIKRQ